MAKKSVSPKMEAHVISHTHWDREWYKPFQGFRFYLIKVIDDVLDMIATNPEYRYFHLDGQTVMLEDYAQIRPERVPELKERIREGRILIGPWYDLSDLFIVDGESLVRNVQFGLQLCKEWGGDPMPMNYSVDLFGHSSQMPQIFAGFGIREGTLFRGVNAETCGSEFVWVAPDGTESLIFRLDDNKAYSNFWYTFHAMMTQRAPYDEAEVDKGLETIIGELKVHAATPYILFMDGVDHVTANPLTTKIIRRANETRSDVRVVHSSWPQYIAKAKAWIEENKPALKHIKGELRITNKSGGLNRMTTDVSSSRIYLKIRNKECETELCRWFEPMRAVAASLGHAQPAGFLSLAWKYLLKNHPHDSICGCSVDQVHRDMEYRFDQVSSIAAEAVGDLLEQVAARVDTTCVGKDEIGICVFNPTATDRSGVTTLKVETRVPHPPEVFSLWSHDGKEIPYQLVAKRQLKNRVFYKPIAAASHAMGATEYEIAADLPSLPANGVSVVRMRPAHNPKPASAAFVSGGFGVLENKFLRVEIKADGLIDLLHKESKRWYRGLHDFEDCGEIGDLWNHTSPAADTIVRGRKSAEVSMVANGPLTATYKVVYTLSLPKTVNPDLSSRSDEVDDLVVESRFTLTRSSKDLRVETRITNNIRYHRLRTLFPTDIRTDVNFAASQFDVVKRDIKLKDTADWKEPESEIKPNQGFVDVTDGKVGLALLNFGLIEYAVMDDERRTLALTLIRSLPHTVGTEGEPDAECMRPIVFHYALFPHKAAWETAGIYPALEDHNLALRTVVVEPHKGALKPHHSFVRLSPDTLVFSSFRNPFGSDNEVVLRVFNPTGKQVKGWAEFGLPVAAACECDLKDEPGKTLRVTGNQVALVAGAKKIVSVRVRFKESGK